MICKRKLKGFKWTDEAEKAFNEIKKLLVNPPVLKAPTPDGLFRLKSDTLRDGVGGTLLQKQGDEWVVIGYHSKRVDHKAIEYMIKSKTESPTTRLKTLLLKLSEYTIELKYQKGFKIHTSNALS